ncbi:hypothetical protein ACFFUE_07370 [Bergeyella porcorum]|uniref:hypothetical protein n=1 Tax=Bergeyella porcorum TaxID=1735111 RepID=UPI0035EE6021
MSNWEYKGVYKKYNMEGIISLPNDSKLQVCDLIDTMPDFMKEADTLFIDPPCNQGNLTSFYTKNDSEKTRDFTTFYNKLFERIDEIAPKHLFFEIFASNYDLFLSECKKRYQNIIIYESFYYNKKSNKCWIFHCSNEPIHKNEAMNNIDEEKAIKYICENHSYNCIGDLCMGTGLVAKYAYLNGKKFVGTELNKKRLALVVDFINQKEQNEK